LPKLSKTQLFLRFNIAFCEYLQTCKRFLAVPPSFEFFSLLFSWLAYPLPKSPHGNPFVAFGLKSEESVQVVKIKSLRSESCLCAFRPKGLRSERISFLKLMDGKGEHHGARSVLMDDQQASSTQEVFQELRIEIEQASGQSEVQRKLQTLQSSIVADVRQEMQQELQKLQSGIVESVEAKLRGLQSDMQEVITTQTEHIVLELHDATHSMQTQMRAQAALQESLRDIRKTKTWPAVFWNIAVKLSTSIEMDVKQIVHMWNAPISALFFYFLCSSTMLVFNKAVLRLLPFPLMITGVQTLSTFFVLESLRLLKCIQYAPISFAKMHSWKWAAFSFAFPLVFNMQAMEYVGVETIMAFRASTTVLVALTECFFLKSNLKEHQYFACAMICFGGYVYAANDSGICHAGLLWGSLYAGSLVLSTTYIKFLFTQESDMGAFEKTTLNNLTASILIIPLAFHVEDFRHANAILQELSIFDLSIVCLSCIGGLGQC
jgi:hypothetical protein